MVEGELGGIYKVLIQYNIVSVVAGADEADHDHQLLPYTVGCTLRFNFPSVASHFVKIWSYFFNPLVTFLALVVKRVALIVLDLGVCHAHPILALVVIRWPSCDIFENHNIIDVFCTSLRY